jgi:adenylate cyclase
MRRTTWSGGLRTVAPEISSETQTALALDDRDPLAHLAQGNLLNRLHRPREAVRALRRALELNPNFAIAHAFLGQPLVNQGANQEAVDSAEHALRLSPRDRSVGTFASIAMAMVHFSAGRYPECITWARNAIERSPGGSPDTPS